jgi:hypothetical protein
MVDFTWSKVCSGLEATEFKDKTTMPGTFASPIKEYEWDFGDGDVLAFGPRDQNVPVGTHSNRTSGTYTNPNHGFTQFQVYDVRLTVNTDDGCTGTKLNKVFILDYSIPTASNGYNTDFENGNDWVASAISSDTSWVFGIPNGNIIQPSTPGNNAWWTGANQNSITDFSTYYNNESSEVISPCLNLTNLKRPMISLDYWSDLQTGAFDGAVVQFSTDGGAIWETIGNADGYGINWYDTDNLSSDPGGDDNFAWGGERPTNGWKNARFNLDQIPLSERDLVVFRVAFASNDDNPAPDQNPSGQILNGFAFDNIYIGEKNRNVLVEHFTKDNSGPSEDADEFLAGKYNDQLAAKDSSDFIIIEYHLDDVLNEDNPSDPQARSILYGVSQAPTTFMDGIQGQYFNTNFTGSYAKIVAEEVDRRALEDPLFSIQIDTVASGNNLITLNLTYTYIDSLQPLTTPVTFHAALIERGVNGNGNVVRKLLLQSEGQTFNRTWDANQSAPFEKVFLEYTIDVPITNPDNLYIVAFVQENFATSTSKRARILQSSIMKASRKVGPVITGTENNPIIEELRGLNIYPNPASKVVNLSSDIKFKHNYSWKLIDQRGVTVLQGNLDKDFSLGPQQIDVSLLANGIYFMAIQTGEKSMVHRKIAVMNKN